MSINLTATGAKVPRLAVRHQTPRTGSSDRPEPRSPSASTGLLQRTTSSVEVPQTSDRRAKPTSSTSPFHPAKSSSSRPVAKKRSGVLSFLTLKEPSTLALEQYAEQQKKIAAEKAGKKARSGESAQKMPEHVPRVNSKWDGLPDAPCKIFSRGTRPSNDGSTFSRFSTESSARSKNSSSDSSSSTRNPFGPTASRHSSSDTHSRARNTSVQSAASKEIEKHPQLTPAAMRPTLLTPTAIAGSQSSVLSPAPTPSDSPASLPDLPVLPELDKFDATLHLATPTEPSPLTPPPAHGERSSYTSGLQPHAQTWNYSDPARYTDAAKDLSLTRDIPPIKPPLQQNWPSINFTSPTSQCDLRVDSAPPAHSAHLDYQRPAIAQPSCILPPSRREAANPPSVARQRPLPLSRELEIPLSTFPSAVKGPGNSAAGTTSAQSCLLSSRISSVRKSAVLPWEIEVSQPPDPRSRGGRWWRDGRAGCSSVAFWKDD